MVINSIIAFVLAALSSAIFAPMTIKLAFRVGAIDIPKDARKIHAKPMPRIGGLSFILAFFIAVLEMHFMRFHYQMTGEKLSKKDLV